MTLNYILWSRANAYPPEATPAEVARKAVEEQGIGE